MKKIGSISVFVTTAVSRILRFSLGDMRQIPPKHRKMIDEDPFFRRCVRADEGECSGRITIEHVFIYGSKQIAEMWNYLPLCWYHHLGAGLNKRLNEKIAIIRASAEELAKYPKKNWQQIRKYLLAI